MPLGDIVGPVPVPNSPWRAVPSSRAASSSVGLLYARPSRNIVGREVAHRLGQCRADLGVSVHELLGDPTVADHQMDEARDHRGVLAGHDLEMHMGAPRRLGATRVHHDQLGLFAETAP